MPPQSRPPPTAPRTRRCCQRPLDSRPRSGHPGLRQASRDRQAEPGPAEPASGRGVSLGERVEELGLRLHTGIPIPVSRTWKRSRGLPRCSPAVCAVMTTSAPSVNSTALEARLSRICCSRPTSPARSCGTCPRTPSPLLRPVGPPSTKCDLSASWENFATYVSQTGIPAAEPGVGPRGTTADKGTGPCAVRRIGRC